MNLLEARHDSTVQLISSWMVAHSQSLTVFEQHGLWMAIKQSSIGTHSVATLASCDFTRAMPEMDPICWILSMMHYQFCASGSKKQSRSLLSHVSEDFLFNCRSMLLHEQSHPRLDQSIRMRHAALVISPST